MKRIRYVGAAASFIALTALASAAAVQGFTIKRTPKEGEQIKYRMKANIEIPGAQATLEGLVTEKTIKIDADGTYTIEASQSELKAMIGDNELPIPSTPPQIVVYKPGGQIGEIRGESIDGSAYRMALLNGFFEPEKPVALNETWTREFPADAKLGTVAAKAEFKIVGEEKFGNYDTLKISANITEVGNSEPGSNVGTFWINKADWSLVKQEGKWTNVPAPNAPA
ncbi:hypothetical protein EON79_13415, partial [bacterium]